MQESTRRRWLMSQYRFLSAQLSERDELFEPLSDEELKDLKDHELSRVVREMQRIANTPPGR